MISLITSCYPFLASDLKIWFALKRSQLSNYFRERASAEYYRTVANQRNLRRAMTMVLILLTFSTIF